MSRSRQSKPYAHTQIYSNIYFVNSTASHIEDEEMEGSVLSPETAAEVMLVIYK